MTAVTPYYIMNLTVPPTTTLRSIAGLAISGLVVHDGRYLAYCWGAAESDDLIHWRELNNDAITGMPDNIAAFTGSVVVDKNNTAQWGDSTLVAVFTSFDKDSKKQSQSVAFSHDGGATIWVLRSQSGA